MAANTFDNCDYGLFYKLLKKGTLIAALSMKLKLSSMDPMAIVGTVITLTPIILIIAVVIVRGKKILD